MVREQGTGGTRYGPPAGGGRPPRRPTPIPGASVPETQGAPGDIVVSATGGASGQGSFLTVGPDTFGQAYAVNDTMSREDALAMWIGRAGIDRLGVDMNWWPGMMMPNLDALASAPGMWREGPSLSEQEPWRMEGSLFTFENLDMGEDDPRRTQNRYVRYDVAHGSRQYMLMGETERAKYSDLMAQSGLLDPEWAGISDFHPTAAAAFTDALALANYYGLPVEAVLRREAGLQKKLAAGRGGRGGRGGGAGPQVKLEIPDYETMVAESKALIRKNLGRDPADWEMSLVADEMKRQYGNWAEATSARMVGGNGTYEIPDPMTLTQEFVEDTYADEISRLEDIGDQTQTNQLLLNAAVRGTQMMGGLGGQGG